MVLDRRSDPSQTDPNLSTDATQSKLVSRFLRTGFWVSTP